MRGGASRKPSASSDVIVEEIERVYDKTPHLD
jgi:hypothetical protein